MSDDDGALFFTILMIVAIFFPWIFVDLIYKAITILIVPEAQIAIGLVLVSLYVMITWIITAVVIIIKVN